MIPDERIRRAFLRARAVLPEAVRDLWAQHPDRILVRAHAPARLTEADRATEDAVRAFHLGEGLPVISHYVADQLPKG